MKMPFWVRRAGAFSATRLPASKPAETLLRLIYTGRQQLALDGQLQVQIFAAGQDLAARPNRVGQLSRFRAEQSRKKDFNVEENRQNQSRRFRPEKVLIKSPRANDRRRFRRKTTG